jgi:uncharacterized protein (TIRG00374 family)
MKRLGQFLARVVPALLSLALLAWVLRSADIGRALGLVNSLGWRLPLLLLPNLVASSLETLSWWLTFERLGARPPFPRLLGVRTTCDALLLGVPSGTVVSETLQPYLLRRRCGVPLEKAIVASVARKFLVVMSHGLLLALATCLAWPLLERDSAARVFRHGLPWVLLLTSLVLVGAASGVVVATAGGRMAARLHRALDRVGGRWLGSWLRRAAPGFERTDQSLAAFFGAERPKLAASVALHAAGWFVRSVETWLFLRLVGADVPLVAAMVVETALILVRSAAVPVPAGLGVLDAAYVLCLRALGVPDATTLGAAFVVIKRGKDLFWIVVGFALLGLGRRRGDRTPDSGPPAGA